MAPDCATFGLNGASTTLSVAEEVACWGEPSVVLTVTEIPVPMPSRFGPALSTPWIVRVLTLPTVEMVTLPELPPALVPPLESGFPFWVQEKVVPTPDGLAVTENVASWP